MSKIKKITDALRREATKPENQRRVQELLAKVRARKQQPPTR